VVSERELHQTEVLDVVVWIVVATFAAQIVNFAHATVAFMEPSANVVSFVPVETFNTDCRETTRDNTISTVGQVQIKAILVHSDLIG